MVLQFKSVKHETRDGDDVRQLFVFHLCLTDSSATEFGRHRDHLHAKQSVCHNVLVAVSVEANVKLAEEVHLLGLRW